MPIPQTSRHAGTLSTMAAAIALSVGFAGLAQARDASGTFVNVTSHHGFDDTVAALKSAIASNNMMVMGSINQANVLSMTGLHLAGAESFLVGNPNSGKKAFSMDPAAGVVLPARIYVWADQGTTHVGYLKPSAGLTAVNPKFGMMAGMLDKSFADIAEQATK